MLIIDAVERWGASRCRSPFTFLRYRQAALSLAHFGIRAPTDATPAALADYVDFRRIFVDPVTVNVDLAALATILRFMRENELADTVSSHKVPTTKPRRLRARHLTRGEVLHLAATARAKKPRLELPILVDALLGLRVRELARLHWDDFDLGPRPVLHVKIVDELGIHGRIKTSHERVVPVCAELKAILLARRAELGERFLFPPATGCQGRGSSPNPFLRVNTLEIALARVVEASGLARVTWNTLRHTRASWWVQAGVPMAKVAFWLGNSLGVCERYYAGLRDGYDPDCERAPAA